MSAIKARQASKSQKCQGCWKTEAIAVKPCTAWMGMCWHVFSGPLSLAGHWRSGTHFVERHEMRSNGTGWNEIGQLYYYQSYDPFCNTFS